MKKENCKWKLEWDYNGYKNSKYPEFELQQYDWNQTLVTKIKQASAIIYKSIHNGGATTIEVNSKTHKLLETLEYYDITHHTMGNRYTVIINDDIEDNVIILYHKTEFISKLSKEKNEDGWYESCLQCGYIKYIEGEEHAGTEPVRVYEPPPRKGRHNRHNR
jgi:hypothetical protein